MAEAKIPLGELVEGSEDALNKDMVELQNSLNESDSGVTAKVEDDGNGCYYMVFNGPEEAVTRLSASLAIAMIERCIEEGNKGNE